MGIQSMSTHIWRRTPKTHNRLGAGTHWHSTFNGLKARAIRSKVHKEKPRQRELGKPPGPPPKQVDFKGPGTVEDPMVTLDMRDHILSELNNHPKRKNACIDIVYNVCKVFGYPYAKIRRWNHNVQYLYEDGKRVQKRDRNGELLFNKYGGPVWVLVPSDDHITAEFSFVKYKSYCNSHVYVVTDEELVPQRLMLIGERKHTVPGEDDQSPQLWFQNTNSIRWEGEIIDRDPLDWDWRFRNRRKRQYPLFELSDKREMRREKVIYGEPVALNDLSDKDLDEQGYSPEAISALRRKFKGDRRQGGEFHLYKKPESSPDSEEIPPDPDDYIYDGVAASIKFANHLAVSYRQQYKRHWNKSSCKYEYSPDPAAEFQVVAETET